MEEFPEPSTEPAPVDPAILKARQRSQIQRLIRVGKNFDEVVRGVPNGQHYLDEHTAVVRTIIRDPSQIKGRY